MNKQEFRDLQKSFAEETRKRKLAKIMSTITTFLSILGVSVISYYFLQTLFIDKGDQVNEFKMMNQENILLKEEIKKLQLELKGINLPTQKDSTEERIIKLEQKIDNLNNIILSSPEKAITIPLLSKDIENLKANNDMQVSLVKEKVETVIDLNKWILGLIFSLLITIVISNLAKGKSKSSEE